MAAGINYFRLLWNLYRQKRNTGRKKEQVVKLQKKKLEKMLLYAYDHSLITGRHLRRRAFSGKISGQCPLRSFRCWIRES